MPGIPLKAALVSDAVPDPELGQSPLFPRGTSAAGPPRGHSKGNGDPISALRREMGELHALPP